MESSSSKSERDREDAGQRKPPLWTSPRRTLIALGAVILVAVVVIYAIDARRDHLERLERTHQLASQTIAEVASSFSKIEPLTAAELSQLRTYRNKDHVAAAGRLGIKGIASVEEASALSGRDELVRIDDGSLYIIQDLDYSVPYLVPSGASLLDRIGERFQQRLADEGLPAYQFVVTSVTRTREHQQALQRVNINAAKESSHEYGTTFDVHYDKFGYNNRPEVPDSSDIYEDVLAEELAESFAEFKDEYSEQLKAVLGRVLIRLQERGVAMTIYERRQPVFHITVARDLS